MDTIRLGIVGFAHMHIEQMVTSFQAMPETFSWVGCADVPPNTPSICMQSGTRGHVLNAVVKKCNIPRVYDNYTDLLDEAPDMVIVTAENARHPALVTEILNRGIHVILEKPMALALDGAVQMAKTAKANKVSLIVNWPTAWDPAFRLAQKLCLDGAAGKPFKFHYRNKESLGPFSYGQTMTGEEKSSEWWYQAEMGGGAMADYIGYGCNLSRWFFGERATSAFAVKGNYSSPFAEVEDFSAATVCYPSSLALLEGSWATYASGAVPCGPIVFGDAGTIVTDRLSPKVSVYQKRHHPQPTAEYQAEPLPADRANLALEVLRHLRTGEPLHDILDMPVNLDAVAAMDACFRSAESGKMETVEAPNV
jgi:glucose-fructose oxidoreductase